MRAVYIITSVLALTLLPACASYHARLTEAQFKYATHTHRLRHDSIRCTPSRLGSFVHINCY